MSPINRLRAAEKYITERPEIEESSETVSVTDPEPAGEEAVVNVPVPTAEPDDDVEGKPGSLNGEVVAVPREESNEGVSERTPRPPAGSRSMTGVISTMRGT